MCHMSHVMILILIYKLVTENNFDKKIIHIIKVRKWFFYGYVYMIQIFQDTLHLYFQTILSESYCGSKITDNLDS